MKHFAICVAWFAAASMLGCGGPEPGAQDPTIDPTIDPTTAPPAAPAAAGAATAAAFTGNLAVSPTSTTVGSPVVVTESATDLTGAGVGPLILGITRVGFDV